MEDARAGLDIMKLELKKSRSAMLFIIPVILLALTAAALLYKPAHPDEVELTVFFAGDLHGDTDHLPEYSTIIKEERKAGRNVLFLNCGDLYYKGPHQSEGGVHEALLLDYMQCDAMVLGNNEFKIEENTAEACNAQIKNLAANAAFPLLCANITKENGDYLDGVKPYTIIDRGGLRIAVIGLTTDDINNQEVKDKILNPPERVLPEILKELEGRADAYLLLSHCEQNQNEAFSGVDAILAGHIHQSTPEPVFGTAGIPIMRPGDGSDGFLGRLDMKYKRSADDKLQLESYKFSLCDITGVKADFKLVAMAG